MEKQVTVELEFEETEVADLFCELGGLYMGHFFNAVARNLSGCNSWLEANLKECVEGGVLTPEALEIMSIIGRYSKDENIKLT